MDATALLLTRFTDELFAALAKPAAVQTVAEQAAGHFRTADRDNQDIARAASVAACILSSLALVASEPTITDRVFSALAMLGPAGELRAAMLLCDPRLPERVAEAARAKLPPNRHLALMNRILATRRAIPPRELTATLDRLREIENDDPEAVLMFLAQLTARGDSAAYPIQNELLRGRFGLWAQELLNMDLDQEQRRYMARTAGHLESPIISSRLARILKGATPETIPHILSAMGGTPAADDVTRKAAELFLRHQNPGVRIAAARALRTMNAPTLPAALASLWQADAALAHEAAALALSCPWTTIKAVLKALPDTTRPQALVLLCALAARIDPEAFAATGITIDDVPQPAPFEAQPPQVPDAPQDEAHTAQPATSLLHKVTERFGAKQATEHSSAAQGLVALADGGTSTGGTFTESSATHTTFTATVFDNATFRDCTFSASQFVNVRFDRCTFERTDFTACAFRTAALSGCTLRDCRLSGATLSGGTISACTLTGCLLDGARLDGCAVEDTTVSASTLFGAMLSGVSIRSSEFAGTDLSRATLDRAAFSGIELTDCLFDGCIARGCTFVNTPVRACSFANAWFTATTADDAELRAARDRTEDAIIRAPIGAKPTATAKPAAQLTALERFAAIRDMRRHMGHWLRANHRRLDWCAAKLGPEAADMLAALPALVEAPAMPADGAPAPGCRIDGFVPTRHCLLSLERLTGIRRTPDPEAGAVPIRVEGLYTIGSVGSIAQTARSDIDMWLCADESAADKATRQAFRDKLAAIERFAEERHALELHFFVMDMASVRDNDFGLSDKESAGSSQALLLKEEFYRTALCLAGRKPAWWATGPGTDEKAYARAAGTQPERIGLPDAALADIGHLPRIPAEEFFGASLWQIVKALKSPFKSIMKFALLEAYTDSRDAPTICERLRENVTAGLRDFWSVDPYAVLFREVNRHFAEGGRAEAQALVAMAFDQRTGFTRMEPTTGRSADVRGFSFIEYFFPHCPAELPSASATRRTQSLRPASVNGVQSFSRQMELGRQVARFMFQTYENIRAMSGQADGVRITDEDLTRLGRKIFAHFQPRPGKIMHIPFMNSPRGMFASMHIACENAPGKPTEWVASGELAGQKGKNKRNEEMHRERHPVRLAAWLAGNGIHSPGMQLSGQNIVAPASLPDLASLLDALSHTFGRADVFDAPVEETLRPERVTRALVAVNMLTEREAKTYGDVALVYATNWGELFCIVKPKALALLKDDPRGFVRANSGAEMDADAPLAVWMPKKCLAPRIATG
ncbi:adenylate cyclase class 1 [Desulfobaculum xiamenense]|uniref:Adenylate cyclase class 1 n=1 Tax=Desulfobaculum xiamenense TaxID=995050 RepID=A0A846QMY5_9BACT|nr:class I adenylate cyclase [Desulfobaculum xiamenense]NJB68380.1 adenylate cyclase class 1 [Desulfobaculum xiamenense]